MKTQKECVRCSKVYTAYNQSSKFCSRKCVSGYKKVLWRKKTIQLGEFEVELLDPKESRYFE
jgi:hypothetical protein